MSQTLDTLTLTQFNQQIIKHLTKLGAGACKVSTKSPFQLPADNDNYSLEPP